MKPEITKKTVKEYEKDGIIIRETKQTINFGNYSDKELTEEEKIRKTGVKKKVTKDNYFPDPCDCGSCINYDDENDLCKKNNEFINHDPHEGGIECNDYNYIYELEK